LSRSRSVHQLTAYLFLCLLLNSRSIDVRLAPMGSVHSACCVSLGQYIRSAVVLRRLPLLYTIRYLVEEVGMVGRSY